LRFSFYHYDVTKKEQVDFVSISIFDIAPSPLKKETFYSGNFILGNVLMGLPILLYTTVMAYLDYGGGRVIAQLLFGAVYLWGVRCIFKCELPIVLKLILCFWWVPWVLAKAFLV